MFQALHLQEQASSTIWRETSIQEAQFFFFFWGEGYKQEKQQTSQGSDTTTGTTTRKSDFLQQEWRKVWSFLIRGHIEKHRGHKKTDHWESNQTCHLQSWICFLLHQAYFYKKKVKYKTEKFEKNRYFGDLSGRDLGRCITRGCRSKMQKIFLLKCSLGPRHKDRSRTSVLPFGGWATPAGAASFYTLFLQAPSSSGLPKARKTSHTSEATIERTHRIIGVFWGLTLLIQKTIASSKL